MDPFHAGEFVEESYQRLASVRVGDEYDIGILLRYRFVVEVGRGRSLSDDGRIVGCSSIASSAGFTVPVDWVVVFVKG